jgi:hypothetical protein
VEVEFYDRSGDPIQVTFGGEGPSSSFTLNFTPGRVFSAQSTGTGQDLQVGYAVVKVRRSIEDSAASLRAQTVQTSSSDTPDISGTLVFTRADNGITMTEAGIPAARPLRDFTVLLDSLDAKDTGLAIVNPAGDDVDPGAPATLTVRVWDQAFENQLGEVQFTMQPGEAVGRFIWEIFQDNGAAADLVTQLREIEAVVTVGSNIPVAALTLRQNDDGAIGYPDEVPILTAFPVIPGRADSTP